jgi:CBS domain containing-hemolysin-like protein
LVRHDSRRGPLALGHLASGRDDQETPEIDIALGLAIVVVLIFGTGFFVASELALVAADRARLVQLANGGDRRAARTLEAVKNLTFLLAGIQLGITVTSLIVGFIAEPLIARALDPVISGLGVLPERTSFAVALIIGFVLATITQMVIGELIPKNLAIARPIGVAARIATPLRWYCTLFRPVIVMLTAAANWTVKRVGIEPRQELTSVRSLQEINLLIESAREEGVLPEDQAALLARSITFGDKTAADALVPRVSVVALEASDTLADMARVADESGHSRFPVCGKDVDDVVGFVHVKDAYVIPLAERPRTPVSAVMHEALVVPESRQLESLLIEMRGLARHLAVVVDEYGGTAGIVTIEDLLEEIVGEIEDEYDPDEPRPLTASPEGIYVISGMLHPDEVREATGFDMPDGDYETIAGFLMSELDRVPEQGDHASYEGWEFKVIEMDRRRIVKVLVVAPGRKTTIRGQDQ